MKILKILLLLVFTAPLALFAVKYPIINYQTSDGLPQSHINTLIQDHLGYILIGTQSGIGKFDGSSFEIITKKDGLPNNFINDFEKDNQGNIWAATRQGLVKIDKNCKITSYMTSKFVRSLKNDSTANRLWIITQNGIYYLKDEKFVNYQLLNHKFQEADENKVKGLIIAEPGVKYFYSQWEILEINHEKIHTIKSEHRINFLKWLDNHKKIAVGTEEGLFLLETGNAAPRFTPYIELPPGSRNITDMVVDGKKRLWVGTDNNGLLIYHSPADAPVIITNENGLVSKRITKIIIDREKNIIIGTRWGISQLSPHLFKMYDDSDGLPSKIVWDFWEDEENDSLLIACDHGIARLNRKNGKITPYSSINCNLPNHSFRVVVGVGKSDFLLGTRERGIYRWNGKDQVKKIHPTACVFDGARTTGEIVWFATEEGLLEYDVKTASFKRFRNGLKDINVWTLAVVDNDTILVGTSKGVQKFYKEKFVSSEFEDQITENTVVNDIEVISPSEIMVATELNGLYIFKGGQLQRVTTANGLLHNDIWSAVKDDYGNVWLSTTVSLERYTYTGGIVSHFNRKTGLFGDEGSIHAAFKSRDGNIYFGVTPGVIEIPSYKIESDIKEPILYIKEIKVNGKKIAVDMGGSSQSIRLTYNQNNIEFEYIAVSTRKENPVFYRTRLRPLDTQWSEPSRETRIKYLNLGPDDYTFEIIAANNGGSRGENQWFKSKNTIALVIIKPFWQTWWFTLLAVILGIFLLFFMIKLRLNHLQKQKKNLQQLVQKRTIELQQLSITDPLTDLKNRRYLEEKIKEDINLIERYIYDKTKHPQIGTPVDAPILGVFILDIDHFKKVNDDYGHKAGDIVIVNIAQLLIDMLRNSDTIVRWGGEEFLIITRQSGISNSFELAERIRKKIESFEFEINEEITLRKTISIGFAHFPFIPEDIKRVNWHHVVSLADSALYIAKNSGRNLSIGIECGKKELDIEFKEIVSNIKMGVDKQYLKLVSVKNEKKLTILQHKT